MNEACNSHYIFLGEVDEEGGGEGLKQRWHNIRCGYLIIMLDYKMGTGVKNLGKSDYVISECSYVNRKLISI